MQLQGQVRQESKIPPGPFMEVAHRLVSRVEILPKIPSRKRAREARSAIPLGSTRLLFVLVVRKASVFLMPPSIQPHLAPHSRSIACSNDVAYCAGAPDWLEFAFRPAAFDAPLAVSEMDYG